MKRRHCLEKSAFFILGGLCGGLLFAWLTDRPSLQDFWFQKSDKFAVPKLPYYIALGLSLTTPFIFSEALARLRGESKINGSSSVLRRLHALGIVVATAPALYLVTPTVGQFFGFLWVVFVAPVLFLSLMAFAMSVYTKDLRGIPLAFGVQVIGMVAGLCLLYVCLKAINELSEWYDYVQWPILEAAISGAWGLWLVFRAHDFSGGNA